MPDFIFSLKGPIPVYKNLRKYPEPIGENTWNLIQLLKSENPINTKRYRTQKLSDGAPFFNICLCLQTRERCSCFIYIAGVYHL